MPLHILTAIALLSAAHQGIQVAASSSNLGAPSSKTAAIPKKRYLRSSASAQDLVATGSQVAGTLVRDGGQEQGPESRHAPDFETRKAADDGGREGRRGRASAFDLLAGRLDMFGRFRSASTATLS